MASKKYVQLTEVERERIFKLLQQGKSQRYIGRKLKRDHTTIGDEIRRNTKYGKAYSPHQAQKRAVRVGTRQRRRGPLKTPPVLLYVRTHLRKRYTPEQIQGRLKVKYPTDKDMNITPEAIYQYIYSTARLRRDFVKYLPRAQHKRRKQMGRSVQRMPKIKGATPIDLRPLAVDKREEVGHYETDLVEGDRSTGIALSVTVERKSRYTILSKVPDKTAGEKTKALKMRLDKLPQRLKRSITIDNGGENTGCADWGIQVYACHPYHSWEKGSVENMNGRIRVTIPKGTDFSTYTDKDIQALEDRLNNTPRKCLGYLTPKEALLHYLHYKPTYKPKWWGS
jgi:transposase, IS30 family